MEKKTLDKLEKVTFFEDDNVWIRGVSLCEYGAALNYDNNIQHQEYGFMAFDFITGNYVHIKGATGAVWEKNIITGENDNDEVILSRVELGEVMVEGFTLTPGANKITLTARDTDGSETTEGTITLMDNLFDDVKINSIADVTVKSGQTVRLPINSQTIESGNDLSIEAVSSDESVLKVKDAYHTQQLDIEWSEEVTGDYFFDGQRAVVEILSPSKQLLFSDCHRSSGAKVECEIYQKYVVSTGHVAQNKIFDLGATTLAYTVNAKTDRTHIIIANKDEVYVRTLKYGAVSLNAIKTFNKYKVLVASKGQVEVYSVNTNDIHEWILEETVTAETLGVAQFCPYSIHHPLPAGNQIFDIQSSCITSSQSTSVSSVFRYSLDIFSGSNHQLPLSNFDTPSTICSFSEEVLIATPIRVYGLTIFDDFNYFTVPFSDLGLSKQNFSVDCVESLGAAVVYADNNTGESSENLSKQVWVLRGNNGFRQDRRYPIAWIGIADTFNNYSFLGSVLSVAELQGEVIFVENLLEPAVDVIAQTITEEKTVEVTVTIKNRNQSSSVKVKVTVHPDQKTSQKKVRLLKQ